MINNDNNIDYKNYILPNIINAINIFIIIIKLLLFFINNDKNLNYKLTIEKKNKIIQENKYEELIMSNNNNSDILNISTSAFIDDKIKSTTKNYNQKNIWFCNSNSKNTSSNIINEYKNLIHISSSDNNLLKDIEIDNLTFNNSNKISETDISVSDILFNFN